MDYAPTTGTGAIVSNVLDYSKWLRALIYEQEPVSSGRFADLFHPRTVISNDNPGEATLSPPGAYHLYALGWFVDNYHGHDLYWHSGSWPGFGIMVGIVPRKKFGFVMMANTQVARFAELHLYLYLMDNLLGLPSIGHSEHVDAMAQRMRKETKSEGVREAEKRLFPSLPEPRIPHSVPLNEYAATYEHSGYGLITLEVQNGYLYASLMDRVCKACCMFVHASGEFFVGALYTPGRNGSGSEYCRVEFYVDETGTPQKLGMDLEVALRGQKIWFQRCV